MDCCFFSFLTRFFGCGIFSFSSTNRIRFVSAINRVHRIGQIRPTFVHRYIIRDTIETRISGRSATRRKLKPSGSSNILPELETFASGSYEEDDEANTEDTSTRTLNLERRAGGGGEILEDDDLWYCLFGNDSERGNASMSRSNGPENGNDNESNDDTGIEAGTEQLETDDVRPADEIDDQMDMDLLRNTLLQIVQQKMTEEIDSDDEQLSTFEKKIFRQRREQGDNNERSNNDDEVFETSVEGIPQRELPETGQLQELASDTGFSEDEDLMHGGQASAMNDACGSTQSYKSLPPDVEVLFEESETGVFDK